MRKFLVLTKVLLKTGVGGGYEDDGKKKSKIKKNILYVILALCMLPALVAMGYIGHAGYKMFEGVNTHIILGLVCYLGALVTFMLGITMCVGVFFGSSDINILLPLPVKAEQIVGAKFVTVYVYTLITDAIILAPVFVGYGIAGEMDITYYLTVLAVMILLPITPLVYGSIMTMIIIRVFKGVRNKDLLTVVTTAFSIGLVLVINTITNSLGQASQEDIVALIMEKGTSIMGFVSKVFPNIIFADEALAGNAVSLLLFAATTVGFVVVFLIVAKMVYLKSVVEMSDTMSKSKKLTNSELKKANKKQGKVWSYTKKELKIAFRTPMYLMNCILMTLIWPVFIMIPVAMQMINGGEDVSGSENAFGTLMESLNSEPETIGGICMVISFAIAIFATSFTMLNSTTISREGKNVFFIKYIPMSYKDQLKAKIMPGIIVNLFTATFYTIVGIIIVTFVYGAKIPVMAIILSMAISVISCVFFNVVEIISDIIKPKLVWETEQAAVKQNFISIIPMLGIMILGTAAVVGLIVLKIKFELSVYIVAAGLIALLLVGTVIIYNLAVKLANKKFATY